jgi:hypothetical protein
VTVAFRVGLALFVVAWLLDLLGLRGVVPIWLPFVVALALELELFVRGLRQQPPSRSRGRLPQDVDREELGYGGDDAELVLVRDEEGEVWVPYRGESEEALEALVAEAREREEPGIVVTRRPFARLLSGLALIAALVAVVVVVESRSGWNGVDDAAKQEATARFSAEAARIVGRPVRIRCDEAGEFVGAVQHADGVAEVGGELAYLTPERCFDLYRLAFDGEVSDSRTGRALAVLAHEAWHLRGERNEGRTECFGLQSGVDLGRRLGLSIETARRLMRQQLAENQLHAGSTAEYLVPAGCRDGGALDLDRESSRFP